MGRDRGGAAAAAAGIVGGVGGVDGADCGRMEGQALSWEGAIWVLRWVEHVQQGVCLLCLRRRARRSCLVMAEGGGAGGCKTQGGVCHAYDSQEAGIVGR